MKSLFSLVFVMLCVLRIAFAQVESRDPKTDLPGGSTKVQKVPDDQEISQEISWSLVTFAFNLLTSIRVFFVPHAQRVRTIQL